MSDVTQILAQLENGDSSSSEELLSLVYQDLRKFAAARLAYERPGQTLQPTALVHEAYVRLVDVEQSQHWNSRNHFFCAAAEAMRRILVDRAREKKALKRGGGWERIEFETAGIVDASPVDELLAVNDLFDQLSTQYPDEAAVAKLHYFAGFNISEAARSLGVPVSSAHRQWAFARAWLIREMQSESGDRDSREM